MHWQVRADMEGLQNIYTNLAGQTELQAQHIATIESEMMRTTSNQAQGLVRRIRGHEGQDQLSLQ